MKKIVATVLSALLAIALCGCAKNPSSENSGGGELPPEEPLAVKSYTDMDIDSVEAYVKSPFYNDKNDSVAYVSNAMWSMFGLVNDGQSLVTRFGNEATWFEWLSEKVLWSGDEGYISDLKNKIAGYPQVDCGFIWSWTTTPYWTVAGTKSLHYDGTFRYIAAVYNVIKWENGTEFLDRKDTSTIGGDRALDASAGKTVYQKTALAMDYILNRLYGSDGHIRITERSVLMADGKTKFFNEWNNTGKFGSSSSNYWDNLCYGNYDAYENALFYRALESMAGIETMRGDAAKASEYTALAQKVKARYDELYYSEKTGRYIGAVDTDGVRHDYGLTYQNFEALRYGLGDANKAKSIFSWIDGERIVDGDTVTGKDILSYSSILNGYYKKMGVSTRVPDGLVLAARSNTVAVESKKDENNRTWWHNPGGISEFDRASYNRHLENGGYIFYTAYYELMSRLKYLGANSAIVRMQQIAEVYEYNLLNSDIGGWMEGLIGEFPESGLVPIFYLNGLLGIDADYNGLRLAPQFGTAYETLGVQSLRYGNCTYAIEAKKNGNATVKTTGAMNLKLMYKPVCGSSVKAVAKNAQGQTVKTITQKIDERGEALLDLTDMNGVLRVNITVE